MAVNVGVIGVGMIGRDHIRRLTQVLAGAAVVALTDVDADRARAVAQALPSAAVHPSGQAVIGDEAVDAVLVTSWGPTHEEYVLAALAAGKPVFCEKPLATTEAACGRIVDAEVAGGRRLVTVGFMRRYDSGYVALKRALADGVVGEPLLGHCTHRNAFVPDIYTSDMAINDTAVHEIDIIRWLFDEEIVATRVLRPRPNPARTDLADPLILLLETAGGAIVDVEVSVNIAYGYDIRCEVVGERGTVALADRSDIVLRRDGQAAAMVPTDWRQRFVAAYDAELQAWLDAVRTGGSTGASAWDGYAATVVAEAALTSLHSGERSTVPLRDRPDFYVK